MDAAAIISNSVAHTFDSRTASSFASGIYPCFGFDTRRAPARQSTSGPACMILNGEASNDVKGGGGGGGGGGAVDLSPLDMATRASS